MKFRVSGIVTISVYTDVEAETKKQAIEIARDRDNCALLEPERMGQSADEVWCHSGEMDGTPVKLVAARRMIL